MGAVSCHLLWCYSTTRGFLVEQLPRTSLLLFFQVYYKLVTRMCPHHPDISWCSPAFTIPAGPAGACGSCDWFGVFEMTHLQSMTKSCVKHEALLLHHLGPVGQLVLLSPGRNRGTATACRPLAVQSQPGGAAEDEGFSGFCSSSLFFSCFFPCPERVAYCSAAEDYFPIWVTAVHLLG